MRFLASASCLALLLAVGSLRADLSTPPFTEAPGFGLDTSAALRIVVNPGGSVSFYSDPTQGPYEGSDDTLVGVVNNSGGVVHSFTLTSSDDIFGFDGDGIDTFGAPGNASDNSGYGGPMTFFTNVSSDGTVGTVNFVGGLQAGQSTYFSLENDPADIVGSNPVSSNPVITGGPSTPEPSSLVLAGMGLAGCGGAAWRRWIAA